jgi:hypothetical protein
MVVKSLKLANIMHGRDQELSAQYNPYLKMNCALDISLVICVTTADRRRSKKLELIILPFIMSQRCSNVYRIGSATSIVLLC